MVSGQWSIATRGKIILLADEGKNHREIARELRISRKIDLSNNEFETLTLPALKFNFWRGLMTRLWRERWLARKEKEVPVSERLQDA